MSSKQSPTPSAGPGSSAVRGLAAGAAAGCLGGVIITAYNPFFVDSLWLGVVSLWAAPAVLGALLWAAGRGVAGLLRRRRSARGTVHHGRAATGRRAAYVLLLLLLVVVGLRLVGHLNKKAPGAPNAGPHAVIIGIDGATWDIMDPMMDRDELPNFEALRRRGASGVLTSIEPTLSPAVWTTIATGKTRAKHGVLDFTYTQEDLRVPRIWELLEGEGKRVGIMSWLVTWPPAVRNGFMIPGWLARTPETYPPHLHFALDMILGEGLARTPREYLAYVVDAPRIGVRISSLYEALKLVSFSKTADRSYLELVHRKEMLKGRIFCDIFCWLLAKHRPDFAAVVFYGTDSLAHVYWKYMDALDHYSSPTGDSQDGGAWEVSREDAAKYGDAIRNYYKLVDSFVPRILSLVPEETTVCVLSDHGHGPSEIDWGYFVLRASTLIETLGLSDKVSVASVGDWSFLSVAPDARPEDLADAVEVLSSLVVSEGGVPLLEIEAKESATLSLRIAEGVERSDSFTTPDGRVLKVTDFVDKTELSGTHRLQGVIMLSGPGIKGGSSTREASITDVTPTLLYLMRSPVGEDMDGRVLGECLVERFLAENPVVEVESRDGEVALPGASGAEEMPETVRKRLRELGYIK